MIKEAELRVVLEQEKSLVFREFDENTAFVIGSGLRSRAVAERLPVVIQISFWDRLLFYASAPGTTHSNFDWVRRKINVVRMFGVSTYRKVLEEDRPDRTFKPGFGLSADEYILAGGGFPISAKGCGVIGAIGISGLPERDDHLVIVEAICDHLGIARQHHAFPADDGSL